MKNTEEYIEYVKELCEPYGGCEFKKMFGSIGIFKDGVSFGGVMENVFRLKVDDTNRADYEAYNMAGWQVPGKKMVMQYYQVPIEIMEDKEALMSWMDKSYTLAVKKKRK
jgi:DNA transformation protein